MTKNFPVRVSEIFYSIDVAQKWRQVHIREQFINFRNAVTPFQLEKNNGRLKKILDVCIEFDSKNSFRNVDELRRGILLQSYSGKLKFAGIFVAFVAVIFLLPAQIDSRIFNLLLGKLKLGDSIEIMRDIYGHEKNITPAETPNHRRCKI